MNSVKSCSAKCLRRNRHGMPPDQFLGGYPGPYLKATKIFQSYSLPQRFSAAFLAISARRSGDSLSRRAAPPFLPSAWAFLSLPSSAPVSSSTSPVKSSRPESRWRRYRRAASGPAVPSARGWLLSMLHAKHYAF